MKISKMIQTIEKYNKISNSLITDIKLKEIPVDLLEKTKAQNEMLENMYNEFNIGQNSYVYKFINTTDPKVKTIVFEKPIFIKDVALKIENFIYNKLNKFKVTFYTIDNSAISFYMLPYEFRGDYIEEIKFMSGQNKSDFRTVNTDKLIFYDIVKTSLGDVDLQRLETDYHEYIDEDGYIIFNTKHKKDKLALKYTPISSEFIKTVNDKITSITLELSNDINNKIEVDILNE